MFTIPEQALILRADPYNLMLAEKVYTGHPIALHLSSLSRTKSAFKMRSLNYGVVLGLLSLSATIAQAVVTTTLRINTGSCAPAFSPSGTGGGGPGGGNGGGNGNGNGNGSGNGNGNGTGNGNGGGGASGGGGNPTSST